MNTQLIEIKEGDTNLVFDKPGRYVVFFSNISGVVSCHVEAEKIELYLVGLYTMKGKEKYKIHTEQIHHSPNSSSDLFLLSVAEDNSSLTFSGRIRIEKDAQKSHAYQKNHNLILSKNAFVSSLPTLEILADDVFCTHGSVSGPLPEDQLQYLQMRGLSRAKAKKLTVTGFKNQVYEKLRNLGIHKYD